jgi:Glycosyl hydrolases family 43
MNITTATAYGTADHRPELAITDRNAFVLPLELRPHDRELGRVWMRDTYVNHFVVGGVSRYYCTGTTRAPGLAKGAPWNDGIYLWSAPALAGPWHLVDTTSLRPHAPKGQVWAPDMVGENRDGHVVVAPYQCFADAHDPARKRGNVWAPELHLIRGRWYLVACMGDDAISPGSFILVSEGGPQGPYRNIRGNVHKPLGDPLPHKPGCWPIDGSLFEERDGSAVYLVLHNFLWARMGADMEDIEPTTALPHFQEQRWVPEPYLEGAFVFQHASLYHLMHAAWSYQRPDGSVTYVPQPGDVKLHYDTVVAHAERFEGPYSQRRTMGIAIGHNNVFRDAQGELWATFFKNPAHGYWADPALRGEAAVAGVVPIQASGSRQELLTVAP